MRYINEIIKLKLIKNEYIKRVYNKALIFSDNRRGFYFCEINKKRLKNYNVACI